MKLLILGGTGVISREIVRQAAAAGHEVTIFNRGSRKSPLEGEIRVLNGDRHDKEAFARQMAQVEADVVIDMICFQASDARQTVELLSERAGQLIFTSSIAAYSRPYHSFPIREECERLGTDPAFAYGFQKAEMERYLQTQMGKVGAAITVIRPSLTFGPGAANFGILRQNRNVVRRIAEGRPVVMTGEGTFPWAFTFTPDLAAAYLQACGNPKTYNDCFQIANTELVEWQDLYKAVGRAVGREPILYNVPTRLLLEAAPQTCGHLHYEKAYFSYFSIEKFQRAAPGYSPKITLDQGVRRLVDWWAEADFPYDPEKELLEDSICRLYEQFRTGLSALRGGAVL